MGEEKNIGITKANRMMGFVILGYIDGEQPISKPRKPGRVQIIE